MTEEELLKKIGTIKKKHKPAMEAIIKQAEDLAHLQRERLESISDPVLKESVRKDLYNDY